MARRRSGKKKPRSRRPSRLTMAGMIYDANESLRWVMNDPEITEAFLNSSCVTGVPRSPIHSKSNQFSETKTGDVPLGKPHNETTNAQATNETETSANDDNNNCQPGTKNNRDHSNNSSSNNNNTTANRNNSYASLFSDEDERDLLGIGFFTVWEAGLALVSGYFGTGIVMSRNIVTGNWSAPVAVGISGVGAGVLVGASARSLVYLIYDYFTLNSIIGTDNGGLMFGIGAGASIGSCFSKQIGPGASYITSPKTFQSAGLSSNTGLSRGLGGFFVGVSIEGGICKSRDRLNARFYGEDKYNTKLGADILMSGARVEIPDGKNGENKDAKRMMERIHRKLIRLCSGGSSSGRIHATVDSGSISRYGGDLGLDIDQSNSHYDEHAGVSSDSSSHDDDCDGDGILVLESVSTATTKSLTSSKVPMIEGVGTASPPPSPPKSPPYPVD